MSESKLPAAKLGELGDDTRRAIERALSLCDSMGMLFITIDYATYTTDIDGRKLFPLRDHKSIRTLLKRFFTDLNTVLDLLDIRLQKEHVWTVHDGKAVTFNGVEWLSYADACLSLAISLFRAVYYETEQSCEVDFNKELTAAGVLKHWTRAKKAFDDNRFDCDLLFKWLGNEQIKVERLVSEAESKRQKSISLASLNTSNSHMPVATTHLREDQLRLVDQFVQKELVRQMKSGMEYILKHGGRVPLKDLAFHLDWAEPSDDAWSSFQHRINKKWRTYRYVENTSFQLSRRDNCAIVNEVAPLKASKKPRQTHTKPATKVTRKKA